MDDFNKKIIHNLLKYGVEIRVPNYLPKKLILNVMLNRVELDKLILSSKIFDEVDSILIIIDKNESEENIIFIRNYLGVYFNRINVNNVSKNNYLRLKKSKQNDISCGYAKLDVLKDQNEFNGFLNNIYFTIDECKYGKFERILRCGTKPNYLPKIIIE